MTQQPLIIIRYFSGCNNTPQQGRFSDEGCAWGYVALSSQLQDECNEGTQIYLPTAVKQHIPPIRYQEAPSVPARLIFWHTRSWISSCLSGDNIKKGLRKQTKNSEAFSTQAKYTVWPRGSGQRIFSANFCGQMDVVWSARRIPYGR
jgi:hypothetical protein